MSNLVILNLGRGDLYNGFAWVTAQLQVQDQPQNRQVIGSLPAAPHLVELYRHWQLLYDLLYQARSFIISRSHPQPIDIDDDIQIDHTDVTHVGETDFAEVCQELQQQIDTWLDSPNFSPICRQLYQQFHPNQDIRVILQTEDSNLRKLPWYTWRFFRDYPHAEVSLSSLNVEPRTPTQTPTQTVRILAILGDAAGIDIDVDQQYLASLDDTETVFLVEPRRQELNEQLWHNQGWTILFFAGHSSSKGDGNSGEIYINSHERLTIPQLKHALNEAIAGGLKLAIFNSCDGLGLARQLSDLQIPHIVVMREPVPDTVAQAFLKYFLIEFAGGRCLDLAVRKARERLQGLEGEFPGASWLPIIVQTPTPIAPSWQDWRQQPKPAPKPSIMGARRPRWQTLLLSSAIATGLVMGVRWLGFLQSTELWAFDALMRMRPTELPDDRLVIITIDTPDIQYQDQQGMKRQGSLADQALVNLLDKIKPHQPAVIGLDIYRDPVAFTLDPDAAKQAIRERDQRFIDICQIGGGVRTSPEIPLPSGVPVQQVGFSDLPNDPDLVIRRQIFGMAAGTHCQTQQSFSFQIARHYLTLQDIEFKRLSRTQFQIGTRIFPKSERHRGGYHNLDSGGFEVLLNYRATQRIAQKVPLHQILDGSKDGELATLIRDRIVLIGTIDNSYGDYHLTPYSAAFEPIQELSGVEIQAQMVSHIISAVLNQRPVVWWFPQWGDVLWVWAWSGIAGVCMERWHQRRLYLIVAGGTALAALWGCGFVSLWRTGLWLPLMPSIVAFAIVGIFYFCRAV